MTSTFELPEEGEYQAVCTDVVDLGEFHNEKWNKIDHRIAFLFQLDCLDSHGHRFEIAKRCNLAMGEKAVLRTFLEQWRAKRYTGQELERRLELDAFVGMNAMIVVEHAVVNEKTYANILSIRPLPKGGVPIAPLNYTRRDYWNTTARASNGSTGSTSRPAAFAGSGTTTKPAPKLVRSAVTPPRGAALPRENNFSDFDVPVDEQGGHPSDTEQRGAA